MTLLQKLELKADDLSARLNNANRLLNYLSEQAPGFLGTSQKDIWEYFGVEGSNRSADAPIQLLHAEGNNFFSIGASIKVKNFLLEFKFLIGIQTRKESTISIFGSERSYTIENDSLDSPNGLVAFCREICEYGTKAISEGKIRSIAADGSGVITGNG